jgi:HK97 family phage portal protein
VWACVKVLADAAASVPLIAYRRSDDGRKRLGSGRLASLLERPAPATTQANLVAQAVAHLTLYGNAYVGKFRDENGLLEQIACLSPENVTVELIAGTPRYTVTDPKTGRESYHGEEDIVHVKSLSTDGLVGLSPIRSCRVALSLASNLGEHAEAFFENGAPRSSLSRRSSSEPEAPSSAMGTHETSNSFPGRRRRRGL